MKAHLKEDKRNNPRFFANSAVISKENTIFEKGVFTSCKIRDDKMSSMGNKSKNDRTQCCKKNYLL